MIRLIFIIFKIDIKQAMINRQKIPIILLISLFFMKISCYIDIELTTVTSSTDVVYNMPIVINDQQYHIGVSLHSQ